MIRIADLHKTFVMGQRELTVLKGISLEIPRGQMVAVVGAFVWMTVRRIRAEKRE